MQTHLKNETHTRTSYPAQGTLPSVTWQPGWQGNWGENGHMCVGMYMCVCMYTGVCMAESLCCPLENITTLLITPVQKKKKKLKKERKEGWGIQRYPTQTMTMTTSNTLESNSKTLNKQTTKLQKHQWSTVLNSKVVHFFSGFEWGECSWKNHRKTAWFLTLLGSVGFNPQRFKIPFLRVLWLPEEYITVNVFLLTSFLVILFSVKCCLWLD